MREERNINYPIITHPRGGTDCRVLSRSCAGLVVYRCPVLVTPLAIVVRSQTARMNAEISLVILAGGIIDFHVSSNEKTVQQRGSVACYSYARLMINRRSHADKPSLSLSLSLSRTISTPDRDRYHDRFHDHGTRSTGCSVIWRARDSVIEASPFQRRDSLNSIRRGSLGWKWSLAWNPPPPPLLFFFF